jgi:hypothetical protein
LTGIVALGGAHLANKFMPGGTSLTHSLAGGSIGALAGSLAGGVLGG